MTRDSRTKIMATIPDKYSPDFADRLDKRTSIARAICGRIEAIETDMGGADALSHARRSLIRRVVWLEAIVEHTEQKLAAGDGIDLGGHTQAINTLIGLYRLLGLERKARPVRPLREVMAAASSNRPETADDPPPVPRGAEMPDGQSGAPEPSYAATEATS